MAKDKEIVDTGNRRDKKSVEVTPIDPESKVCQPPTPDSEAK